jgi:hypothetical protein
LGSFSVFLSPFWLILEVFGLSGSLFEGLGGLGGAPGAQRSEKGTSSTPPSGGSLFGHFLQNVLKSAILCCFLVVFFQWQEKVHKIMGKSTKNGVILGSPTLNPIEPARSDRMSAVFSQSWKKCSKMTPKVTLFGVILGATFATILLFGGPGVQIVRKKGESKKDRQKVTKK